MSVELEGGGGGGSLLITTEVIFFPKILLKVITNDVNIYNIISGVFFDLESF